jgi:pimeloyl-ACP methyl ester carboxylesterase
VPARALTSPRRTAWVLALAALALSSCTTDGSPSRDATSSPIATSTASSDATALDTFYAQQPQWSDCGDGFECTRLQVPLDYADPGGDSLELSLVRLPAANPASRIGSLLVNPGGPGGSGLEYARGAPDLIGGAVRERYDIVGFDPRGVGESTPLRCQDDAQTDEFLAADGSPDDAAEEQRLVDLSERLSQLCSASPEARLLPYVSTENVARDLDILRGVLGDKTLTYLGKSYGTFIGATYAELFPDRAGRVVLDGAVAPDLPTRQRLADQAAGFEVALNAFVDDCVPRPDCPLGSDRDEALATFDALLTSIDSQPLDSSDDRDVTQSLAVLGVIAPLYDNVDGWPILRRVLQLGLAGIGDGFLALADVYTDRARDGRFTSNSNDVIYAVNCLDRPASGGADEARAAATVLEQASPRFGPFAAWSALPCGTWPVEPVDAPRVIAADGAPPILVVGTTRDPATPYAWSERLAGQLSSGVLLTYEGDGHTAYRRGSSCIDANVDRFLLEGTPPADGTRCT